ncbi:nitrile-specifier protein 2 [Diplogelasinospora grovesii]|uniref:Nitrile-specifier protein 2 n=1 Tax=Diplogelasinospora grovesii TaxID=303347 RepID=A0AAN6NLR7_9PEZI|nr:nitrile-specifier protein 2 [Diplogelasinospora grovesii]
MDSFKSLKRRTTDLLHSASQSLPSSIQNLSLGGHHLHSHGAAAHNTMKGTWEKISSLPPLPRSSHSVDIVAGNVYIFGGEGREPRKPVDNDMHVVTLPSSGAPADYYAIKAKAAAPSLSTSTSKPAAIAVGEGEPTPDTDTDTVVDKGKGKGRAGPELGDVVVPSPRVGHATAVIGHRIFMFGGRGGPDMKALDEGGRVWVFDTRSHLWSYLDPAAAGAAAGGRPTVPEPRSYHSAVATDKPNRFGTAPGKHSSSSSAGRGVEGWRQWASGDSEEVGIPQRPIVGHVAETATDLDSEGYGTLVIHGGCLAEGRAADVWAFDVHSRVWQKLPDAPGKPRGGTSLAISRSRLYRFGGFNGEGEEGGQLDYLELAVDSFDDASSKGEVTISARGGWQSLMQGKENVGYKEPDLAEAPLTHPDEEQQPWPGYRSVAGMEAVTVGGGREYLVLFLGERDPSEAGHAAAGKFWDDVWAFQVPAQSNTAASLTDTVLSAVGRKSGEGKWTKVEMGPRDDEDDASAEGPGRRGWIASAPMGELEENGIVVWGGLNGDNQRLGDGWILRLA